MLRELNCGQIVAKQGLVRESRSTSAFISGQLQARLVESS